MRLIDADHLLERVDKARTDRYGRLDADIGAFIDKEPTIEPKRGRWKVAKNKGATRYYVCSECDGVGDTTMKFCPNCGARMGGEDEL